MNVGSLLGTINDSASKQNKELKEFKSYSPPKKQKKKFKDKKVKTQKEKIDSRHPVQRKSVTGRRRRQIRSYSPIIDDWFAVEHCHGWRPE